jgi:hypothetical protein
MTKQCRKCGHEKPLAAFGRRAAHSDGLQHACRPCYNQYSRKWVAANPEQREQVVKTWRKNNPEKVRKATERWKAKNHALMLLYKARYRAKKNGEPFDLTETDIVVPAVCPVLDIPLQRHVGGKGKTHDDSPTLDKIVPALGYVKGNVAVISGRANRIKNDASAEEHRKIANWIEAMSSTEAAR